MDGVQRAETASASGDGVGSGGGEAGEEVVQAAGVDLDLAALSSMPEPLTFPTSQGDVAHGLFYPPSNPGFVGPPGEKPPLVVIVHGGPTAATSAIWNPIIQFWTTRGLAVLDVDYRGSTGYGRAYRRRLQGHWGIHDVEDCVAGATYLAGAGRVDGRRMATCAVYGVAALRDAKARFGDPRHRSLQEFLQGLRVREVGADVLRTADPDLLSFTPCNTPEEYARALRLADIAVNDGGPRTV